MADKDGMVVTLWEVSGEIDYDKLIQRFGTKPIGERRLERVRKHSGEPHLRLGRSIFYSNRDLDHVLDEYERGNRFVLYTGRGPSGPPHIGHLAPWIFTKHLQDVFSAKLLFQITDDDRLLIQVR